jgi:hypothetical protein
MRKISVVLMIIFAISCIPTVAWADPSPWMSKETNQDKMMGKLGFGLKNLFGGWTLLIERPARHLRDDSNKVVGLFAGLGEGAALGVLDTVGGALHVVTFPLTGIDIPLPEGGVKLEGLEPKA